MRSAVRGLRHAKMRSFLTMLGIIIGITSVILLMSLGASAQNYILDQVQSFGSDIISINPGAPIGGIPAAAQGIVIKTLNKRDADSMLNEPSIIAIAARVSGQGRISYSNVNRAVVWHAVSPEMFTMSSLDLSDGRYLTEADSQTYSKVAVLGSKVAEDLFGDVNPIGKSVRLRDFSFQVVGVLASKGAGVFSMDDYVMLPLSVGQKQLLGIDYYHELSAEFDPNYDSNFVKSRVVSILRQNHHITDPTKDDFTVASMEEALDMISSITSALTLFLTAIAFISLVVGGIGIMNIMLVSVVERTREIGLRKALGATNRDIMQQFLVESVLLTVLGGIIGIALGALFAFVAYIIVSNAVDPMWAFAFPLSAVGLSAGVATVTGLVFGLYPARQAAKKRPIEALRYE